MPDWYTHKIWLIMRLTIVILIASLIQVSAAGFAQRLTLTKKQVSLESIFHEIHNQTGYEFLYNRSLIKKKKPVDISVRDESIESVLKKLTDDQQLQFSIEDKVIVIKEKSFLNNLIARFQAIDVRGKILDESGQPLVGATVAIKGSGRSVKTNEKGAFYLQNVKESDKLVINFVGYQIMEVSAASDVGSLTMVLAEENFDDVIVVGYGTQNKSKITGAVSQVGAEVFKNRPIVNLAQGLQGAIPNLNISFGDGQLNRGGTFNIRGFTSINGGSALILIDGTPGEINLINPEDVESVTVLKDASSAAIYGARAAFGVILITTKKAEKGKVQIRYTNNFGFGNPIGIPSVSKNTLEAAIIQNDAYRGYAGTDAPGMANIISYLRDREENPSLPEIKIDAAGNFTPGASVDWYDEFYNNTAPFSKNYLSISGSKEKTGYFLSVGHENQSGIFKVATDDYAKYSLRFKLDNQLADWIKVYNNLELNQGVYDTPNKLATDGGYNVYRLLSLSANPYNSIKTANGNYTQSGMQTFGQLESGGRTIDKNSILKNTLGFNTNFFKNRLRVNGDYTYFLTQGRVDSQYFRLKYEDREDNLVEWSNPDYYASSFSENKHQIINLYTEYEDRIDDHHFKGLIGFNQELNQLDRFNARRDENIIRDLGSLNLTNGIATLGAKKSEWALQGFFGRLNYDFKNRYLIEFNGRYDGTSRFEKESRFGFFPSVSTGWVVSNEPFFKPVSNLINSLKIRGSYGSLGNQLVSDYAYISSMIPYTTGELLDVGGQKPLGIRAPGLTPFNLTWETTTTLNAGFDLSMLKNKLGVGFDLYKRDTKNMLTKGRTLPAVLGTSEPRENAADLSTKGWELSMKWNDQFQLLNKPFSYNLSVVLSDNRSFITRFDNPNKLLSDSYYEGMEIGEIWGYKTLGFFKTDDESATHADQSKLHLFPGLPKAGDIKFEDTDRSGVIDFGDNTVNNPGDLQKIGNSMPRYAYGFNLGFNWANLSVSAFFQGVGKRDFWPGNEAAVFWGFYNRWNQPVYEHIVGNYWTPENPDAYFPRLRAYEALTKDRSLGAVQTRYLQDASYLRFKSLTVGYSLPKSVISRVKLDGVRVFFSGQNLFEWTKLSKAFDPEGINDEMDSNRVNGAGFVYPLQRTYTFGLEINL